MLPPEGIFDNNNLSSSLCDLLREISPMLAYAFYVLMQWSEGNT